MKTRLITLLTMGRTLDRARDRKGAYTLRHINQFPKFGPAARAAAAGSPPAGASAPSAQPSLFAGPKAPAAAAPPVKKADRAGQADPTDRAEQAKPSHPPPAPGDRFLAFAKLSALLAAAAAVVPKTAAGIRGRLRSRGADARPRAQAELALEKVTVLRNDLSDADLVVVEVQPKTEDSRAAEAPVREPAANTWTRVTARWIKLKNPAEDGSPASVAPEARARRPADWARTSS
jgi:hypothetical protein